MKYIQKILVLLLLIVCGNITSQTTTFSINLDDDLPIRIINQDGYIIDVYHPEQSELNYKVIQQKNRAEEELFELYDSIEILKDSLNNAIQTKNKLENKKDSLILEKDQELKNQIKKLKQKSLFYRIVSYKILGVSIKRIFYTIVSVLTTYGGYSLYQDINQ